MEAVNCNVRAIRPTWPKSKMEGVLEERIDRGDQRLQRVVQEVQKLMVRRILKTVFSPVSPGAAARIAVKFVSLAI